MTPIKLITVTNMPEHASMLIKSAEKQGWDLVVIHAEWKGFGTKLIETYNYLKAHPEVERFVFADAFDVVVLGTPEEFDSKLNKFADIFVSAERGLWPPTLHMLINEYVCYQQYNGFNYPNSGCYYANSKEFIKLIEQYPVVYELDDQYWINMVYLSEMNRSENGCATANIRCDNFQTVFNSHSFVSEGEYTYENNRVQIMGNQPVFLHFNGKTVDETFNERVKI